MKAASIPVEVSVIIPTFDRAELVIEAVHSVQTGSFRNFEIIVVDDGSADDTAERLRSLGFTSWVPPGTQGEDPAERLLYLRIDHGGMPGRSRNEGVKISRGRFIAFLDSDDIWLPAKLEKQLTALTSESPRIHQPRVCHTREIWLRNGKTVSQTGQRHKREGDIFPDSLVKCIIGPSTVLLERKLFDELGGFREDIEIAEDYEFWLRLTSREKVLYIDEPLIIKRAGHGSQLSEKYGHIELFRIRALKDLLGKKAFDFDSTKRSLADDEFRRKCRIYAAGCRKRGKPHEAAIYEEAADGKG